MLYITLVIIIAQKTASHLKLLLDQSRHNEIEIGGGGAVRIDGENHRLWVKRGCQIELNIAESLQEKFGDVRGNAHKCLDFLLGLAGLPHLGSHSIHIFLDPGLEIIGCANLSLGVVERRNHVVHELGPAARGAAASLLAVLAAARAEGLKYQPMISAWGKRKDKKNNRIL